MEKFSVFSFPNRRLPRLSACAALVASALVIGSANAADLLEVYEQAKTYDADFQTAKYNQEAALERVPLAKSAFRPQLTFGAEGSMATLSNDGDGRYLETALSLTLTQSLYNRSDAKLVDQAEIGVLQADAQYAAVGQTLILRVATAYFDVLRAKANGVQSI